MINFKTIFCLFCFFSVIILPLMAAESSSNVQVALPSDSKITIRWVMPPNENAKKNQHNLRFSVGPDKSPWIGISNKYLINPVRRYFIKLSNSYKDLIQLDNGALFISTPTEFGFIVQNKQNKQTPVASFQPISRLPIPGCRMFKGADNCVYFSGLNKTTSKYEVYLLKPENLSLNDMNIKTLKGYSKIFSGSAKVYAVSGDGNVSFISIGNTILRIPKIGDIPEIIFSHPYETITQFQYNKQSGLFYSTRNKVGYIGKNGQLEFFKGKSPQISLSGKTLYIFCEKDFGILAFDHIDDLSGINLRITGNSL